jgi:hypothetical protein
MMLTNQQQKVLEALSEFRYLTVQQMLSMDISKSPHSLRKNTLSRLTDAHRKMVKSHDFGWIPQRGRLSRVYYLTAYGVKILSEIQRVSIDSIDYPKGGIQYSSDYTHRLHFINFHIRFKHWADQQNKTVEFFHAYFDKIGSQRAGSVRSTAKTCVQLRRTVYKQLKSKTFIPDGLTRYQDGNKSRLVVIEIHNGVHSQRITQQLLDHLEALQQGLFSDKYQHNKANYVLSVHENEATLKSVKNRLIHRAEFQPFLPLFLFNTQAQTNEDFSQNWTLANGGKTALFG